MATIEIQVENLGQLFDSFDPFPFRERDLDSDAEQYIVSWARELPRNQPIEIVIYVAQSELPGVTAEDVQTAIRGHFAYCADLTGRDLSEMFRVGRLSLVVGLCVLAICVLLRELALATIAQEGIRHFLSEGLLILGSVANWRPLEIFLYDWWPVARRRNLFSRLSDAKVLVVTHGGKSARKEHTPRTSGRSESPLVTSLSEKG
jgi:hypothetical protein